jgi:hypothetical protein
MQISNLKIKKNNTRKAFTLIEALVFLFIFSITTLTFYQVYANGAKYIINSKNRLGALYLANEKMEIIRNMRYEDIGTDTGAVSGSIPENEIVVENAGNFNVHTLVEYVQDSTDGVYPADTAWQDYKKVSVAVSWQGGPEDVRLTSFFVANGLEVQNPGDGILVINVFSDQPGGTGIPNSLVHVVNSETGLNTTVQTDASGSVTLTGDKITDSIHNYQISLVKSGYETVNTFPPYPTTAYNPVDVHASVVTGSLNVANIVQNELSTLVVKTMDYLGNAISDIDFHIEGGRKLGTEAAVLPEDPVEYVYNLESDSTTNSSGEKDFGEISPGFYYVSLAPTVTDYIIIDTSPASPISIFSNQDVELEIKLANVNTTSLLLKIVSNAEGNPSINGAEVKITNSLGYDVTQNTSEVGVVFFPVSGDAFVAGDYDIEVSASGYTTNNSQITVIDGQLNMANITLISS